VKTPVLFAALTVALAAPAWAADAERTALGRIAFTTDATLTKGCTLLGRIKDDEVKDLRRKVARLGGDTAVVAFGYEDIVADVYRCPVARVPSLDPNVPPPPAGAPPPPPPPPAGAPPPPPR
jgi:hypothetical protein